MERYAADTLGIDGTYYDPLWRITVELSPAEKALLAAWPVRRLGSIAHAGAAALSTTQTYSRLEHSLGVLALVTHFAPEDRLARATALLHDVGHLPFSHTLEGIGDLDHHSLGRSVVRSLAPLLEAHDLDAEDVIAVDEGRLASPLTSRSGGLKLDHLDSFLRSGQAHGRTRSLPSTLLERLRLRDGTVDTDEETALEIERLVLCEARAQRSPANIVPVAVLRHLVTVGLSGSSPDLRLDELPVMTDDELLVALRSFPSTAAEAETFRRHPLEWELLTEDDSLGAAADVTDQATLEHRITRAYLTFPTVDGELRDSAEADDLRQALPVEFRLRRR